MWVARGASDTGGPHVMAALAEALSAAHSFPTGGRPTNSCRPTNWPAKLFGQGGLAVKRDAKLLRSRGIVTRPKENPKDELEPQQGGGDLLTELRVDSPLISSLGWPLNFESSFSAAALLEDGRMGAHVARDQRPTPAEYRVTRPFDSSS